MRLISSEHLQMDTVMKNCDLPLLGYMIQLFRKIVYDIIHRIHDKFTIASSCSTLFSFGSLIVNLYVREFGDISFVIKINLTIFNECFVI